MLELLIKTICAPIFPKKLRKKAIKNIANTFVPFGKVYNKKGLLYEKYAPKNTLIQPKDKCLIICPHPDDEVIGCGGIMAKYGHQFDCVCMSSSGVVRPQETLTAPEIADQRIKEFKEVMKFLRLSHFKIFKIFGKAPHFKQIIQKQDLYTKEINFGKYDYIFLPDRFDAHREHRLITNFIIPECLKKGNYKKRAKIVFYGVWSTIFSPNYFEDISEVIDIKEKAVLLYKSRIQSQDNYASRIKGLNYYYGLLANTKYAEAYKVIPIKEYLKLEDDKSWAQL